MSNTPEQQFNTPPVQKIEQGVGEPKKLESTQELIVLENSKLHEQCQHTSTLNHQLESALLGKDGKEKSTEGSKLNPEIVGYFTDGLGPVETMHRLRQLGAEGAMAVKQAIQEGNLERVISIMDSVNPDSEDIKREQSRNPIDFQNPFKDPKWFMKLTEYTGRQQALRRQLTEMYGANKDYSPNEWDEKVEQLRRMLGADPVQKPESEMTNEERQEMHIREKIKAIPDECADLRRTLLKIKPSMRRIVLISDERILKATDADWVRMRDAMNKPNTPKSTSAVQVSGGRFPTRR